jgi:hypothetical protein
MIWPRKYVHVFTLMDFQWGQYIVIWYQQIDNDRAQLLMSISSYLRIEQRIDRFESSS